MAKILYICSRIPLSPETVSKLESKLNDICEKLSPDNITTNEPLIHISENSAYAVFNPTSSFLKNKNSILLGQLFEENFDWHVTGSDFPDGSYALFRDAIDQCEIVSDPAASRTIWYYHDENVFISSTSQRSLILYLGSFEFNEKVIPWMLSTGSLGPEFSWDKRIKCIPPGSSVVLNKKDWTVDLRINPVEFKTVLRSDIEHEDLLKEVLKNTFAGMENDLTKWSLPLSGGFDSRGILLFLTASGKKIKNSVTWALQHSQDKSNSDATIAKELSGNFGLENKFYPTDPAPTDPSRDESMEVLVDRFLQNGEGRIDYFSGFAEGFKIWKDIFEQGTSGLITGDECFGGPEISSALTLRRTIGFCLCSDFANLKELNKFGIPEQEIPEKFKQKENESLSQWRDRSFQEYRIPVVIGAVSDHLLSYTELINPLISQKLINIVSGLPDHLRKDKILFRKIISSLSPDIRFNTEDSDSVPKDIYNDPELIKLVKKELNSEDSRKIFSEEFLNFIEKGISSAPTTKNSTMAAIKKLIPRTIKNFLRDKSSLPNLHPNVLAFRVFLIVKMNDILYYRS